jgi:outer membrane receptor protein involved in Fe transport
MRSLVASLTRTAALGAILLVPVGPAPALEGRIVMSDNERPVGGAEVTVLGRTGHARADAEGCFHLLPDPAVPFEVLVVLPGERFMKPVRIEALPAAGPLIVRVAPLVAESVTVTTGAAPDIEAAPASANTLLSRKEIEVRQPANLSQALENVAGVSKVSEGQAAVPAIRGLARGRTLLLLDGARVSSERRVGPSATYLDPVVVESIQVSRGPGSVAYGSDAFGGVIHVRTERPVPAAPLGVRLLGSLGAGEPQQRLGVSLSRGFSQGGIVLQGHWRDLDDYRSSDGDVFNSGASDRGLVARAENVVRGGLLAVGWQGDFGRDIERPRNHSRGTRFYYPTEDSHRFTASYDRGASPGLDRLALSTFFGTYHQVTDQDTFATADATRRIERADVEAKDFQVRATVEKQAGGVRLDFGLDVNGRFDLAAEDVTVEFDAAGAEAARVVNPTVEDASRTDAGLFLAGEGAVHPRILLAAGGRVDRVATSNRGGYFGDRSTANAAASGYGSVTVGPFRGLSFVAQVARGFRDPMLSDRYFRGVTGRGFITGNPDLEPETSTQIDGAVRLTGAGWRGAVSLYQYRLDDLIERYADGEDLFFFRNRGRARIRGIEVEAQAELARQVTVEASFTRQGGTALDDDAPLDDIAPMSFAIQVRKGLGTRAFVQARGALAAADDEPGPTEVETPGYGVLDLSAGYAFVEGCELRVLGRNLLDEPYSASPDSRAVLAPGRSGLVTLAVRF